MDSVILGLRVLLSLAAVLGVIWYAHRRITKGKRPSKAKPGSAVTVIGRQGIAQKASVVIVEADGKRLVLGVTEHAINVLSESIIEPEPVLVVADFAEHLAAAAAAPAAAAPTVPAKPALASALARPALDLTPASQGLLSGSILSAETWKRSITVLRQGLFK